MVGHLDNLLKVLSHVTDSLFHGLAAAVCANGRPAAAPLALLVRDVVLEYVGGLLGVVEETLDGIVFTVLVIGAFPSLLLQPLLPLLGLCPLPDPILVNAVEERPRHPDLVGFALEASPIVVCLDGRDGLTPQVSLDAGGAEGVFASAKFSTSYVCLYI